MERRSLLALLWLTAPGLASAAPVAVAQSLPQRLEPSFVVSGVDRAGRSAVFTDHLEAARVRGELELPPAQSALPGLGERSAEWRRAEPDENGALRMRGGYALARFESEREEVAILAARGCSRVFVNGEPRVGDLYDYGNVRLPVPLRAGANEFLFRAGRGALSASLEAPPAPIFLELRDLTAPDLVVGEDEAVWLGVFLTNATTRWQEGLDVVATSPGAEPLRTAVPLLAPCSQHKVAVQVAREASARGEVSVQLQLRRSDHVESELAVSLATKSGTEKHTRTFRSEIDGSVQYYAVSPPSASEPVPTSPALTLTFHGAGVEASGQAACFAPRPGEYVVAPTNRRKFGFDWEDWGRMDALEVWADAAARFHVDPRRTYLTGHSMGGHGTWIFGSIFGGRFAAIGPSAGWEDFWSYAGAGSFEQPTAVETLLSRAANVSRTSLVETNLVHGGVYVLHGDADDNVPVGQARTMREHLARFHPDFCYFEQPDAGHWWGNPCVDWPRMTEYFGYHTLPEASSTRGFSFTTLNPGVSARCRFATIVAQERALEPSTIDVSFEAKERRFVVRTQNVLRLELDLGALCEANGDRLAPLPATGPVELRWNERTRSCPWPEDRVLRVEQHGEDVATVASFDPRDKNPERAGPFKEAWNHRALLVVGTHGTQAENDWALAKARFDAETFWYRGNGAFEILPDQAFDPAAHPDRSVVLYGNEDTNLAFDLVLDDRCPVEVRHGRLEIDGVRRFVGDQYGVLFVQPRKDSTVASVAVVAGTGLLGMRSLDVQPYFVSGVAYPDWTVFTPECFERGSEGIVAAGFFDVHWSTSSRDAGTDG